MDDAQFAISVGLGEIQVIYLSKWILSCCQLWNGYISLFNSKFSALLSALVVPNPSVTRLDRGCTWGGLGEVYNGVDCCHLDPVGLGWSSCKFSRKLQV